MIKLSLSHFSTLNLEDIRTYLYYSHVSQIDFIFADDAPHFAKFIYSSILNTSTKNLEILIDKKMCFCLRFWVYLKQLICKNINNEILLIKQDDVVSITDKSLFDKYYNLDNWLCDTPFYENSHLQIDNTRISTQSRLYMLHILLECKKASYCKITLQRGTLSWKDSEIDWLESILTSVLGFSKSETYHCILNPELIAVLACFLDCIFDLTIGNDSNLLYAQHDFETGYFLL